MSDIEKLIFEQWKAWELELNKLAYDCQVDMCAADSACRAVRYSTAGGLEHGHVVGGNFEPCAAGTPIQRWAVVLYTRLLAAVHREVERQCAHGPHSATDVLRAMTALRGNDNVVLPAGPGIRVAAGPTQDLASFSAETRKPAEPTESDVDEEAPQVAALRRAGVRALPQLPDMLPKPEAAPSEQESEEQELLEELETFANEMAVPSPVPQETPHQHRRRALLDPAIESAWRTPEYLYVGDAYVCYIRPDGFSTDVSLHPLLGRDARVKLSTNNGAEARAHAKALVDGVRKLLHDGVLQLTPKPADVLWKAGSAHVDGVPFAAMHRQVGTPNTWILGGMHLGGRFEINAPDAIGATSKANDIIRAHHLYAQHQKEV